MACGRGVGGEAVQQFRTFGEARRGGEGVAEDDFFATVVGAFAEEEGAGVGIYSPSGEDACGGENIRLGVTAIDTEGVEFEEFASEVFIESAAGRFVVVRRGRGAGAGDAAPVVQIDQHGTVAGDCAEEVAEISPNVGADGRGFVVDEEGEDELFAGIDIEVIEPKIDEDFLELALRMDGAEEFGGLELAEGGVEFAA